MRARCKCMWAGSGMCRLVVTTFANECVLPIAPAGESGGVFLHVERNDGYRVMAELGHLKHNASIQLQIQLLL